MKYDCDFNTWHMIIFELILWHILSYMFSMKYFYLLSCDPMTFSRSIKCQQSEIFQWNIVTVALKISIGLQISEIPILNIPVNVQKIRFE